MQEKYLSENFTTGEVQELFTNKGFIQMVTAPTGAGKTYFVQSNVLKIAKGDFKPFGATDKKALLLANRSALVTQIKRDLEENLNSTNFTSYHEEQYITKYVDIYSYQALAKKILTEDNFLDRYKLIIADECHYFLSDSWNGTTQLTLNKLVEHSKDNTILFFSATTEELKSFLRTMKNDILKLDYDLYREVLEEDKAKELGFNDRLNITVTNEDIDVVVSKIPTNEKFVIFVNELLDKNSIEELSDKYSKEGLVGFLYSKWEQSTNHFKSNDEMNDRYNKVLENEGFYDPDMWGLIANNAIDNGVNFKMKDLKHIILLNQYDFTQIRQFIGRKRHDKDDVNDVTNVYVIAKDRKQLETIKRKCDKTMDYYKDYNTLTKEDFLAKYCLDISKNSVYVKGENAYLEGVRLFDATKNDIKRNNEFPFLITFSEKGVNIYPNYCQIQKAQFKLFTINGVLEQIKEFTMATYFYENLKRFYDNVSIIEVDRTKTQNKVAGLTEIPEYLDSIKGKAMTKDEYKELRKLFKERWEVKDDRNGRVLGDKAFIKQINKKGFTIISFPENRVTMYSVISI
ncbi:DEAD/DEAH box helicase family protein [uncultured Clostridium sp.]|uniref:DEAD/DEAH box helicase n=1 Tax=uncultured Clostridium sp. TaxID=59620 RepID=UPI0025E3B5CE|nr:DEAD/DEAH box helicase family protein [uncultured Clostridium sp.]